jgi:UDP-glucose 4-epimerase
MKIIVTGGAGFIGSNIVDELIKENHEVVIIDNLSTGFENNINPRAKFYKMDIRDDKIEDIFKKESPEIVMHLAAQMDVRVSTKNPIFDAEINIGGTINLLENCVKYKVKKIIYSNTGGALYGEIDKELLPIDEKYPIKPLSQYGISKHTVEHYLYLYHINHNLNYTSLRYPNVYGDRQNPMGEAGVLSIFINKMLANEPPIIFGDGKQTRDYVYVKDVVIANLLALREGNNKFFNLGSGQEVSVLDIFYILKKILNFNKSPIFKPKRIGEVRHISLNSDKALEELKWEPKTSLEEGIRKTIEWQKKNTEY